MYLLKQNLAEEVYSNRMMSNVVQSSFKFLEYTSEDIKKLHHHISEGGDILDKPINKRKFTDSSYETIIDNIIALIEDMRQSRRQMKFSAPRRLRDIAASQSETYAYQAVKQAFPTISFIIDTRIGKNKNKKIGLTTNESGSSVHLILPITWYNKIWKKNISVVRNSRNLLFVVDISELKLSRLNENNIRVYSAVFLRNHRGSAYRDHGWLMVHETDNKPVTAAYHDFAKCERLLNRRIKDRSLGVLAAL